MSRIVTALFASRGEAEAARMRLASAVKVESARIIAQDTAGALIGLQIADSEAKILREALTSGDHAVIANVAHGADPAQIVHALCDGAPEDVQAEDPKLSYSIGPAVDAAAPFGPRASSPREGPIAAADAAPSPSASPTPHVRTEAAPAEQIGLVDRPSEPAQPPAPPASPERTEIESQVRIGDSQMYRGRGARPIDNAANAGFESRAPARRLSDEEVQAGGLLKDRVVEVIEMREEPVITREVVVREEIMIRKTVDQRSETIRDTVRHTDVAVEDLEPGK